jgi:hypothetical protein
MARVTYESDVSVVFLMSATKSAGPLVEIWLLLRLKRGNGGSGMLVSTGRRLRAAGATHLSDIRLMFLLSASESATTSSSLMLSKSSRLQRGEESQGCSLRRNTGRPTDGRATYMSSRVSSSSAFTGTPFRLLPRSSWSTKCLALIVAPLCRSTPVSAPVVLSSPNRRAAELLGALELGALHLPCLPLLPIQKCGAVLFYNACPSSLLQSAQCA